MKFPTPGIVQKHLAQRLPQRAPSGRLLADPLEAEATWVGVGYSALDGRSRVSTNHIPTVKVSAQTGPGVGPGPEREQGLPQGDPGCGGGGLEFLSTQHRHSISEPLRRLPRSRTCFQLQTR